MPEQDSPRSPHRSREGTYECLRKSFMEDYSLSDFARSITLYAAAKPEGWKLIVSVIAREMSRPPERVRLALRELCKADYAEVVTETRQGRPPRRYTVLCREKALFSRQKVAGTPTADTESSQVSSQKVAGTSPQVAESSQVTEFPQVSSQKVAPPLVAHVPHIASTQRSSEYCSVLLREEPRQRDESRSAALRAPVAVSESSDNEAGVSKLPGSKISFDGPAPWDEPSPATTIGELRRLVAGHVPPEAAGTPAPEPARLAEASRQQAAEIESFLAGPPPAPSSSYSSSTAAPAPELAPLPPGPSANPDCPDCARRGSECAYHRDVRELEEALSAAETSGPEDDEYAGLTAL